jgi:predicted nucleic acid-binding protein
MADFFDSNVILYMTDADRGFRDVSRRLIGAGGTVSVQVLNETTSTLRRKLDFSWAEVAEFLAGIRAKCDVVPLSLASHERGLSYAERYRLNIYDAMIVASAVLAGCDTLYSEDMHDGLVIDGLTIRNPYRPSGPQ